MFDAPQTILVYIGSSYIKKKDAIDCYEKIQEGKCKVVVMLPFEISHMTIIPCLDSTTAPTRTFFLFLFLFFI
jgi:hypothetical protein